MTKVELIAAIADRTGIDRTVVSAAVEAFMVTIKDTVAVRQENVYLRGFGTFSLKQRAAATGRDLKRNTTIDIPAHAIPYFKPCATFRRAVAPKDAK